MRSLSFNPSLPEMIYEDTTTFRQSVSSTDSVDEQYDTFSNARKLVSGGQSVKHVTATALQETNDVEIEDPLYDDTLSLQSQISDSRRDCDNNWNEDLYDDAVSVRKSIGLPTTNHSHHDEESYDDAVSVRRSMGLPTMMNHSPLDTGGLYEDAVSLRQSIGVTDSSHKGGAYNDTISLRQSSNVTQTNMEGVYDDAVSLRESSSKGGVYGGVPMDNEDTYDDAVSVRRSLNIGGMTNGISPRLHNGNSSKDNGWSVNRDRSFSTTSIKTGEEMKRMPQPYEKVKLKSNGQIQEPTYGDIKRRKMTTRRIKLPSVDSAQPTDKRQRPPLTPSSSVGSNVQQQPKSPSRSPVSDKKDLVQQATVLSPNVPVAWQYRLNALSKESDYIIPLKQATPIDQQPYEEIKPSSRFPFHEPPNHQNPQKPQRNHLKPSSKPPPIQTTSPTVSEGSNNTVHSPYSRSPVTEYHHQQHQYSSINQHSPSPNLVPPTHLGVPRSASPTYMTIPEHRDIYSSLSSGEFSGSLSPSSPNRRPRSPGDHKEDVTMSVFEYGVRKMRLSSRKSVPVVGSNPPQSPPTERRRVSSGYGYNFPPKPVHVSNPFQ